MNLFNGIDQHGQLSLLIAAVVFLAASGLALVGLIAFGARAGLVAPKATGSLPPARDAELLAFLGAGLFGLISAFGMAFLGLGENYLDNPAFFPLAVGPLIPGGILFVIGVALALTTIRRRHAAS